MEKETNIRAKDYNNCNEKNEIDRLKRCETGKSVNFKMYK